MESPQLQPPEKPDKNRGGWLPILLVAMFGSVLAVIFTILTMGYFLPLFVLGFGIFGIIALQYVLWGWWFERIYRRNLPADDGDPKPSG